MVCLACSFCGATDNSMDGFIARSIKGIYSVTSSVDVIVTGQANTDLLVCVPYPESNTYQDIFWLNSINTNLIATFPETGEKYIRYAKQGYGITSDRIERRFIFRHYDVVANLDMVTQIYPYDVTSDTYKIYTRRPEGDNLQIDPSNAWVIAQRDDIMLKTGVNLLSYARQAYALVASEFSYMTEEPDIETVIANKGGQCGGLTAVIVSLLRARGIPSRPLICKRSTSSSHVFGEFYLQNYGWVPFDITKDLGKTDNFSRFGSYGDSCIIMTRDMHQSVTSEGGRTKIIKLLQSHSFWYWYNGGTTKISVEKCIERVQGCLGKDNTFVPYDWIDHYFPSDKKKTLDQYEEIADSDLDGDGMDAAQEYVAGTDPANGEDFFKASIDFASDGKPLISWLPKLSPEEATKRKYTKYGKLELNDNDNEWTPIVEGEETNYNFFKISVEIK